MPSRLSRISVARLWTGGAELNSSTDDVEVTLNSGAIAVTSSRVRSGAYAWRANPSGATGFWRQHVLSSNSSNTGYLRVYVNIATAPGGTIQLIRFSNVSNAHVASLRLNADRTVGLFAADNSQVGSNSAALSLDTWYRLELKLDGSTATSALEGKVDGTTFASGNNSSAAPWGCILWGAIAGNNTSDIYFDDVAINDSTGSFQNSWPGEGKVIHLRPNAAGDASDWSNDYASVDEVTPDDATTLSASYQLNQTDDHNLDASGLSGTDTVRIVSVGVRFNRAAGAGTNSQFVLRVKAASSGTVEESSALTASSTTWATNQVAVPRSYPLTLYDLPGASTTAWTASDLDSAQIGYRISSAGSSGREAQVSAVWMLVEYVASTAIARTFDEVASLSDSLAKLGSRQLAEAQAFADSALRSAGRALSDGVSVADSVIRQAGRTLADAISPLDSLAHLRTRAAELYDAAGLSDALVRTVSWVRSESASLGEGLARVVSRSTSEAVMLGDSLVRVASRTLAEAVAWADTFARANPSVLFATGTYTGNGTDGRAITGVGFTPKVVLIKKRDAGGSEEPSVWKTDTMGSGPSVRTHSASPSVPTTAIKTIDADGFTLGTHAAVNRNTSTYVWYAWGGQLTKTGTYTGNGSARSITGLGGTPKHVTVLRTDTPHGTYHRFESFATADSMPLFLSTPFSGRITAIGSDGFSVGTEVQVNESAGTYHYVAHLEKPGFSKAGTFTGNGADNRSISGVGFQPDAMIWTRDGAGNSARNRSSAIAGDNSQFFSEFAETTNEVQAFESDGFQVGSSSGSNPSGETVHYIAYRANLTEGSSLSHALSDAVTLADSLVRSLVRTLSEAVTQVDVVIRRTTRNLADAVAGSDVLAVARLVPATLAEAVAWADALLRHASRNLSEAVSSSDDLLKVRSFARELSEAPTLSAAASIAYARVLSEAVSLLDTLRKVLNGIATFYQNTYERISAVFSGTYSPTAPSYAETHEPENSGYAETYTPGATEHQEAHLPGNPEYRETYRDE